MSDNSLEYNVVATTVLSLSELSDIARLYHDENWLPNIGPNETLETLIAGSFCFVVVRKHNHIIGTGRVLSDGITDAYLHNIVVDKKYRGQQIGKQIVQHLIDHCYKHGIKWLGLIANPGTNIFYERLGFSAMKNATPMIMRLE